MFNKLFKRKDKTEIQENRIIGYQPQLQNSHIVFNGKNNILVCDKGVKLVDSEICFQGDNSLVYLKSKECRLNVGIFNNSVFYVGTRNYFNQTMKVVVAEEKNVFFGNYNNFSLNIKVRNSDAHPIYDIASKLRINFSNSIYIGDCVWIGQDASLLKGTHICSGSVVGAQSVVANKIIPANTIWCGNPAKQVRENIVWHKSCVNGWQSEETLKFIDYTKKKVSYSKRFQTDDEFCKIEESLNKYETAYQKYLYLKKL